MTTEETKDAWLGIDFSGDHTKWAAKCNRSNVYVARVHIKKERYSLRGLETVQDLPGQEEPFQKLVGLLKAKCFTAAAIDAPFSVPCEYLPSGGHEALLELVAGIERPNGHPFPAAQDFACRILSGRLLLNRKPLRRTELAWRGQKVNVRSTLWAGPRGGAAMTAACLTLLQQAKCPIWPWHRADEPGLLVEAFPGAQLCHWGMKYEKYDGNKEERPTNRKKLVDSLSRLIEIPDKFRDEMEQSADALDAVLCAFAAIAVSKSRLARGGTVTQQFPVPADEGQIAVHEKLEP